MAFGVLLVPWAVLAIDCSGEKISRTAWSHDRRSTGYQIVKCNLLNGSSKTDVMERLGAPADRWRNQFTYYLPIPNDDYSDTLVIAFDSSGRVEWVDIDDSD